MVMEKAILYDSTKCVACRACQVACKQWNQNSAEKTTNRGSYENPPSLGRNTWMRILFNESFKDNRMQWFFTKHQCMHCTDAACVEVCPSGATVHKENKLKDGSIVKTVVTDADRCVGCNYCRVACPYEVPGYGQEEKGIFRCTLCVDRLSGDKKGFDQPACVKSCAPGALVFGDRADLLVEAAKRVKKLQDAGNPRANLYGEKQMEGLRYLYVLADNPEKYGLPTKPSIPIGTKLWKALAKPWGGAAAGGLVAALVVNGVINARNRGLEEKFKLKD